MPDTKIYILLWLEIHLETLIRHNIDEAVIFKDICNNYRRPGSCKSGKLLYVYPEPCSAMKVQHLV